MHDLRGGGDCGTSLAGARPGAVAGGDCASRLVQPGANKQQRGQKTPYPLPLELLAWHRAEYDRRLFGQRSFARNLAVPAQPDCAARRLGAEASAGDANRVALRSDRPRESSARIDLHAAARWTKNAKQYQATGSLRGEFLGVVSDCAHLATATRFVGRVFSNATESVEVGGCLRPAQVKPFGPSG